MPAGKHKPNNLNSYLSIHETAMAQYRDQGFIVDDTLVVEDVGAGLIRIGGRIDCAGGVRIDVEKTLEIVDYGGSVPLVQTIDYSYSAVLNGRGNIFRYCSPHGDDDGVPHHPHHHVHRFDVLAGDEEGAVTTHGEEQWPTLAEVFEELRGWCADNAELLAAL